MTVVVSEGWGNVARLSHWRRWCNLLPGAHIHLRAQGTTRHRLVYVPESYLPLWRPTKSHPADFILKQIINSDAPARRVVQVRAQNRYAERT